MTVATIRRMGNSLGVVIPKADVAKLKLHEGDKVEFEVRKAEGIETIFGMFQGQLGDIDQLMKEMDTEDAEAEAHRDSKLDAIWSRGAKRAKKPGRDA